jgi:hypothetical protein
MFPCFDIGVWLMVDACFMISDSAAQEGITFLLILVQEVVTDIQMNISVVYHELLWNPPCTDYGSDVWWMIS